MAPSVSTGVVLNTEPSAHVADEKVEIKEENMEILLDENVNDKQGVAALGIQTGDIIAMDPRTVITESGYIKSRFLDDKLSAAILLGVAHAVKEEGWKLNRKVTLLFTVYEEVGSNAAHIYGNHLLRISRYKASAMAYLLINRKEQCDLAV